MMAILTGVRRLTVLGRPLATQSHPAKRTVATGAAVMFKKISRNMTLDMDGFAGMAGDGLFKQAANCTLAIGQFSYEHS
jgi:hypothetical protein